MKNYLLILLLLVIGTSCVSKKKYIELENKYTDARGNLQKLELKFDKIEKRVDIYNAKINSLKGENVTLEKENALKLDINGDNVVISKEKRVLLNNTLAKVDAKKMAKAKTLKDSINLALSYNIEKGILGITEYNKTNDLDIEIDQTVVMISISEKLLFNSGSYQVKKSAIELITKLADIIQSEPSMDVMIEGHTDSQTIQNESVQDNWDLSVKRATSIVRLLQDKFSIDGSRLIAAGRGDTMPLFNNSTKENRAKNRRTRIVILPNLNKFFALMAKEGVIETD